MAATVCNGEKHLDESQPNERVAILRVENIDCKEGADCILNFILYFEDDRLED